MVVYIGFLGVYFGVRVCGFDFFHNNINHRLFYVQGACGVSSKSSNRPESLTEAITEAALPPPNQGYLKDFRKGIHFRSAINTHLWYTRTSRPERRLSAQALIKT